MGSIIILCKLIVVIILNILFVRSSKAFVINLFFIIIFSYNANAQIDFERNDIIDLSTSNVGFEEIVVADIDMDVVSASRNDNKMAWYENTDGLGNFGPQKEISDLATSANSIFIADIDGDSDMDVLFGGNFVAWYENIDGLGSFGAPQIIGTTGTNSVHAADIDGDGYIDVLTTESNIKWYRNINGEGAFSEGNNLSNGPDICEDFTPCTSIFMNNVSTGGMDGDIDILSCGWESIYLIGYAVWYENVDGLGTFGEFNIISRYLGYPEIIYPADIDGDLDLDVFVASELGNESLCAINQDGLGYFSNLGRLDLSNNLTQSLYPIDIDGDKDIFYGEYGNKIGYSLNDNFSVRNPVDNDTYEGIRSVYPGDINGDGEMDVVFASSSGIIRWYKNMGTLSIDEFDISEISIYPNPTSENVNIISKNRVLKIFIYNNTGQLVLSNSNQIDVSNLKTGMYFCKIIDKNRNYKFYKITKQ